MSGSEARFLAYADALASVLGHADRAGPLRDYSTGLMLPLERKSIEPLAAATATERVSAQHQSLMHFVSSSPWSDEKLLGKVRELVLPAMERHGPIEAWIIDDTGFRKQGHHSVGVARQYLSEIGKQDNCQVAVSLSVANAWASLPVAFRLYLPKAWAYDQARRKAAHVAEEISFATKPQIALEQIRWAVEAGLPRAVVLMDPGYGHDAGLRAGISALGLTYVAGVLSNDMVFYPNAEIEPSRPAPRRGRHHREPDTISLKEVALSLPASAWCQIKWREGNNEPLSSRFARLSVYAAGWRAKGQIMRQEWLLIEWPEGEEAPTKYWLSTLPADVSFERLVELAKLRWRIERGYHDLKQELGLDHFEERSWRGFHHHATLCIAAYGFLISERETIPPSGYGPAGPRSKASLPAGYRPRGASDPARAAHPQFHRDTAPEARRRSRPQAAAMSMLLPDTPLMTQ
ncbi:MAG: IS701 family transposase [Mesorhizobium sp.]|uniref:IS701 family transposase n=1 Tax=Mesorhizobium sp. TaxID=1871066 RepID=UPI000FE33C2A|nr:IS701 family transposase [Mesorhizobium sp.]RWK23431.1 MAG: IS701 family transposase [Mesorhizobium sp.]RWK30980.1 MAG: IS701 family transposase [Mesorhizobium sp.]TIQ42586.1 MAG: IS701 family transposase [Mesorhizobium sp.]